MLLAIDTSNDYAGVALWNEYGLRAEATWFAGRQHTEQVLPQIDLLLHHAEVTPQRLAAIAVATGPGSWSGLRAGMSLAKALAIGRGLPLIGVPALDALAYGRRGVGLPVLALIRLGRDRFGAALYDEGVSGWARSTEFETLTSGDIARLAPGRLLVGDLPGELGPAQAEALGARLAHATEHQRRASYGAELAWMRHIRGDYDDLVALEPIYLGSPVRG
jgi:tRNA threonylcarbamoyladenosine biosynthesis protein TsaB